MDPNSLANDETTTEATTEDTTQTTTSETSTEQTTQQTETPAAEYDVSQFGEAWLKDGKPDFAKIADHLKSQETRAAELAERKGEVPEAADKYDINLPDVGLHDAEGKPVQFDSNDPLVAELRELAHGNEWGQKEVDGVKTLFAKALKAMSDDSAASLEAHKTAELAKLDDDPAKAKEIAVSTAKGLVASFGEEAKGIADALVSADAVRAGQHILKKVNAEGSGTPPTSAEQGRKPDKQVFFGG